MSYLFLGGTSERARDQLAEWHFYTSCAASGHVCYTLCCIFEGSCAIRGVAVLFLCYSISRKVWYVRVYSLLLCQKSIADECPHAGPILLFCPFYTEVIRIFIILSFIGMHTGIGLTMMVEAFSVITPVCLAVYIPSCFWDRLLSFLSRWPRFSVMRLYYKKQPTTDHHPGAGSVETALRIGKTFCLLPQSKIFGMEDIDVEAPYNYDELRISETADEYFGEGWWVIP